MTTADPGVTGPAIAPGLAGRVEPVLQAHVPVEVDEPLTDLGQHVAVGALQIVAGKVVTTKIREMRAPRAAASRFHDRKFFSSCESFHSSSVDSETARMYSPGRIAPSCRFNQS